MNVEHVMTADVIAVGPEDVRVHEAARLMSDHGVSGSPIVDADGYVLGLVTEVVSIAPALDIGTAARILHDRGFRRLPVVREGRLVGIGPGRSREGAGRDTGHPHVGLRRRGRRSDAGTDEGGAVDAVRRRGRGVPGQ